ncbi:MAG: hypothetical protein RIC14_05455 [Filomicrobium sp.]
MTKVSNQFLENVQRRRAGTIAGLLASLRTSRDKFERVMLQAQIDDLEAAYHSTACKMMMQAEIRPVGYSFDFEFNDLDYEIGEEQWLLQALSGEASIYVNFHKDDQWHVHSVTIKLTDGESTFATPDKCRMLERAINRCAFTHDKLLSKIETISRLQKVGA